MNYSKFKGLHTNNINIILFDLSEYLFKLHVIQYALASFKAEKIAVKKIAPHTIHPKIAPITLPLAPLYDKYPTV